MLNDAMVESTLDQRRELFARAMGFEGLDQAGIEMIAAKSFYARFDRGEPVFRQEEACEYFHLVAQGMVKVFIASATGVCLTYLLATRGEPLNLIGPFSDTPRILAAQAMQDSLVACVPRQDFVDFVFANPRLLANIMSILGKAIDSANSRIVDMMEKRVEQRLIRVLTTLYEKFGDEIKLTSGELADLAGTTTETTLRTLSRLRGLGVLESKRGGVKVLAPDSLRRLDEEPLWV